MLPSKHMNVSRSYSPSVWVMVGAPTAGHTTLPNVAVASDPEAGWCSASENEAPAAAAGMTNAVAAAEVSVAVIIVPELSAGSVTDPVATVPMLLTVSLTGADAPVDPVDPVAPVGPVGPVAPVAPVGPFRFPALDQAMSA